MPGRFLEIPVFLWDCFIMPHPVDNHKKSFFFRSVNAIFGKVGWIATNKVILQLVFSKCNVYPVIVWFRISVVNSI